VNVVLCGVGQWVGLSADQGIDREKKKKKKILSSFHLICEKVHLSHQQSLVRLAASMAGRHRRRGSRPPRHPQGKNLAKTEKSKKSLPSDREVGWTWYQARGVGRACAERMAASTRLRNFGHESI